MKQVLSIIFLLLTFVSYSQEKKCSDFKTGKFIHTDPDFKDLVTIRTDSIQREFYPKTGWEMIAKIKWLSDCKYEMEYIKANKDILQAIIGTKYVIEIIEINDNRIKCKSESGEMIIEKEMIKTE